MMFQSLFQSLSESLGKRSASIRRAGFAFLMLRVGLSLWFWVIDLLGLTERTSGVPALEGIRLITSGFRGAFIDIWLRWDSVHYLRIAQFGYAGDERSGFYPLYPLLGRISGFVFGGDTWLGLLFVSNLFAFLAFYLLDLWMVSLGREKRAAWTLAGLALFPTGFFLLAGYPHSLLLFLALAGVWCMANKRYALAFAIGLAAGLTHSTALPLALLFALWPTDKSKLVRRLLVASGPPLGIGSFLVWRVIQGFPPYAQMMRSVWGRGWIAPWTAFIQAQQSLGWSILVLRSWPNILIAALSIYAIIWVARSLPRQHAFYQAGLVILLLATGTEHEFLAGFGRYALSGYPLFAVLPAILQKGRRRAIFLAISSMIQLYLSGLFVLWAFVG
ncbi:MAG: mannosyltransferase family protein [Anaerolineales bacterium]|jgi:Gpi18-like mannosyltransferase